MSQTRSSTGIFLAFLCMVLLGTLPVLSNNRPLGSDPLVFALLLSLWQVAVALPVMLFERKFMTPGLFGPQVTPAARRRTLIVLLFTGAIFGLSTYAYVLAAEKAGAVSAAIAIQAYPVFAMIWETLFLKRRKSWAELGFTLLLIAALYYLGTGGEWAIRGLSPWILVALAVPLLWSIAHVIIKEVLGVSPVTPAQVTLIRVLASTLLLGATLFAVQGTGPVLDALSSPALQSSAFLMGIVYYLELLVWFYAIRHIDVSVASSVTVPWPVLTLVLAVLFLGEPVHTYQVIALVAVAGSLYGLLAAGARKRRAAD
ncbi:DMT family transporter [Nisaea sediminum]|uniref:DMT family transporter n=1 Tax=Nisaea sediminum TaxID=2775867 RepID=UPI001866E78C|nr:DMT family transporter [Nisaea sediminum]